VANFWSSRNIPANLPVGDVWFDPSKREFWIAIGDGRLAPLASLLAGPPIHGIDGAKGDTGAQGPQGLQGVPGPQGPAGPAGAVLYVGDAEMAAAVEQWKQKYIDAEASWNAALDMTMLESFRNSPSGAIKIQGYLNRIRHHRGDRHQAWSPQELTAIRNYIRGGGTVEELVAACVKS
jgi:hypothetical protein